MCWVFSSHGLMLITFLCICPLEKWLFLLKAFIVSGWGESYLGCFKKHSWSEVYAVYKWSLFVLVYFWLHDYLMGLLSTLDLLFCDRWWQLLLSHSCLSCLRFPGKELPWICPSAVELLPFPLVLALVVLAVKCWLSGTHIPANALDRAHSCISHKRVQYSSLISQSYWNQIIK